MTPVITQYIPEIQESIAELATAVTEVGIFFFLDKQYRIVTFSEFVSASQASIKINIRALLKSLIAQESHYVVVLHNHPSQKAFPSKNDFEATQRLVQLGELLSFSVLDHLIITKQEYFSFAENGVLASLKNPFV